MASQGDLDGGVGGTGPPAPIEPDIQLAPPPPVPDHALSQQHGPGSHDGSTGSGIYQTVYSPDPNNEASMENMGVAFSRLTAENQKKMLEKFEMDVSQALYPTHALQEIQSDVDMQLEDLEEKSKRSHKRMEIGEKKLRDMDDLGTVLQMKMKEREKQEREINQIGLNRQKETELVKTLDTLERVQSRKIVNPTEIAERMASPGSYR